MPKHSPKNLKVTPFSVKRKQINFNLLDTTSISRNSSQLSIVTPDNSAQLVKEKDEKIKQLKENVDKLNKELQNTRHQTRLMENERQQFEAGIQEKYEKEKSNVELELRLLKQSHLEKIQHLSLTIDQLYKKIDFYKHILDQNKIQFNDHETVIIDNISTVDPSLKRFIKDAYHKANQEDESIQEGWSSLQRTTMDIKHEINQFNAWKSIPIHDLIKVLKEEQKHHSTVKSLLFGRIKK